MVGQIENDFERGFETLTKLHLNIRPALGSSWLLF